MRICAISCPNIGSAIRSRPYTPIFDIVPVSSIVTGEGASLYAAGSQVWNGISGTFTAKPASTPTASHIITWPQMQMCVTACSSSPVEASEAEVREIHAAGRKKHRQERQQQRHDPAIV